MERAAAWFGEAPGAGIAAPDRGIVFGAIRSLLGAGGFAPAGLVAVEFGIEFGAHASLSAKSDPPIKTRLETVRLWDGIFPGTNKFVDRKSGQSTENQ